MKEIGICIVTHNDFFLTKIVIDRLIEKTNTVTNIYIVDNCSSDLKLIEYLEALKQQSKATIIFLKEIVAYPKAVNIAFRAVNEKLCAEKYCVLFPINTLIHKNWIESLIHNLKTISSIGIASIRSGNENVNFIPLLHKCESMAEDELRNVLITENNSVEGILCFKTELFNEIGYFDETLINNGFEQADFCFRIASLGMNNIYIRKNTCVKIPLENEILFPKKTIEGMNEFKNKVNNIVKNQMFNK